MPVMYRGYAQPATDMHMNPQLQMDARLAATVAVGR
jgi:hypothetical protein